MHSYHQEARLNTDRVDVMRGGQVVSTLTGALGQSIKETRITAVLGYLIALQPEPFLRLFGFSGVPRHVGIETFHDDGRSDILIETNLGDGVIEVKLDASDALKQSRRYPARWIALLCRRRPATSPHKGIRYVHWDQLAAVLRKVQGSGSAVARLLSADLARYLEDINVTKRRESVEIYAREINEPVTLGLFLRSRLYGCEYTAGSRLGEALYFAPHFGQRIAADYPGVTTGISYVAQIDAVHVASKWRELIDLLAGERGRIWCKQQKSQLDALHRRWTWPSQRFFLFLGEPRLVFNPPVRKENLQKGSGWLSKRFLSFDELFRAWKA
jgi:hypothetical protein